MTLSANQKRLIVKNPINTARIKILLEMFPDAKFIHIYRNPYSIYASTNTLYKKLVRILGFQTINEAQLEENIIFIYKQMMQNFLVDKNSIPPENLI
ncbi:MAG: sulfotransferase family protein [Heteroscytonema crispum UTEX LB 1556]